MNIHRDSRCLHRPEHFIHVDADFIDVHHCAQGIQATQSQS